jgi:hypothetical protein
MPAVKSIPIKNEDDKVLGYRFEPSNEFQNSLKSNYVEMVRPDGKSARVNKKLARNGHYTDKGFEEKRGK